MTLSANSGTLLSEIDFLANVSHEIRNPLNTIIGLTHLLQEEPTKEDQQEYLKGLLQTSESLLGIVNNFLDFSKLESGKLDLEKKPIDIRKIVEHNICGQRALAQAKDIDLKIETDPNLPPLLMADSLKLGQVLVNLVSNAIKFTEKGFVTVRVDLKEKNSSQAKVLFSVCDTGIGIPQDKLEDIFNAFDQGSGGINLKYGGTGLGLSISKSLIKMMDGDLNVESRFGQGSIFAFALPLEIPTDSTFNYREEKKMKSSSKNLRVLLVDDSKLNRLVVKKYLECWEMNCSIAENGKEALEKVQKQDFDIVLMDLHMPVLNGFEAVRKIRQLPGEKYRKLPFIALSAATDHLYQERIKAAGISDFINKPFRPQELLDKLITHCQHSNVVPEVTKLKNHCGSQPSSSQEWQNGHTCPTPDSYA